MPTGSARSLWRCPAMPTDGEFRLDPRSGLAELRRKRHAQGRDLKVVVTQRNSETGGGKTTLAVFLALSWDINGWDGEQKGTVDPEEFLEVYPELPEHSCIIMDEAEELDARRSMASENVDFSHYWMAMRVRQVVSILTLPSTSALDTRLWELADVWINVECRGRATLYDIGVNSFSGDMITKEMCGLEWPDLSSHPEMQKLDRQKAAKIERGLAEIDDSTDEETDPEDATREEKKRIAQQLRDDPELDMNGEEIGAIVDRSDTWVYDNTESRKSDQPTNPR